MKIAVVTTFNQKLYDYYAHRFMKTYNWPFDLYVYHEGDIDDVIDKEDPKRIKYRISETDNHPNAAGHKFIADFLYEQYKEIYNEH